MCDSVGPIALARQAPTSGGPAAPGARGVGLDGDGVRGGGADKGLPERLRALSRNLWWTWHPEVVALFRELDPIRWRQLGHNPIALLGEFPVERLEQRV